MTGLRVRSQPVATIIVSESGSRRRYEAGVRSRSRRPCRGNALDAGRAASAKLATKLDEAFDGDYEELP